jgi:hypothetical protein
MASRDGLGFSDRANPVFAREIVRGFSSRLQTGVYVALLLGGASFVVWVALRRETPPMKGLTFGPGGDAAFLVFAYVLTPLSLLDGAWRVYASLRSEIRSGASDDFALTGVAADAVVSGHVRAAVLRQTVGFAAAAPILAAAYLLRGVSVLDIATLAALSLVAVAVAAHGAAHLACVSSAGEGSAAGETARLFALGAGSFLLWLWAISPSSDYMLRRDHSDVAMWLASSILVYLTMVVPILIVVRQRLDPWWRSHRQTAVDNPDVVPPYISEAPISRAPSADAAIDASSRGSTREVA